MSTQIKREGNILFLSSDERLRPQVSVFFNAGSRYDKKSHGLAHLAEHILLFQNNGLYVETLEKRGVLIDGETTTKFLSFTCKQDTQTIGDALAILCDMITSPTYTEQDLKREKSILKNELLQVPPSESFQKSLEYFFGKGHPLTFPTSGRLEDIENITLKDIDVFVKDRLHSSNALFVVIGEVDQQQIIETSRAKKAWSELPPPPHGDDDAPITQKEIQYIVDDDGAVADITVFIPLPNIADHKNRTALALIRACLTDHYSSLLYKKLRFEHGYVYGTESDTEYFTGAGYLEIRFTTHSEHAQKAIELTHEVLSSFETTIDKEDLETFKSLVSAEAMQRQFDSGALATWYAEDLLLGGSLMIYPTEFLSTIQSLTLPEIQAVSGKYLRKSPKITNLT